MLRTALEHIVVDQESSGRLYQSGRLFSIRKIIYAAYFFFASIR